MSRDLPLRALRAFLGLTFVAAGLLKVLAPASLADGTVVGRLTAGSETTIVVIALAEVYIGVLLVRGIAVRVCSALGTLVSIGFLAYLAWSEVSGHEPTPCGCFGAVDTSFTASTAWIVTRNLVLAAGFAALFRATYPHRGPASDRARALPRTPAA